MSFKLDAVSTKIGEIIRRNRDIGLEDNPQFNKSRKRYDWRNYIPDNIRELWSKMSVEARVMVYLTAQSRAVLENWD